MRWLLPMEWLSDDGPTPTTFADERATGEHDVGMRGHRKAAVLARLNPAADLSWLQQIRQLVPAEHELKSKLVRLAAEADPRIRDLLYDGCAQALVVIIDLRQHVLDYLANLLDGDPRVAAAWTDRLLSPTGKHVADSLTARLLGLASRESLWSSPLPLLDGLLAGDTWGFPHPVDDVSMTTEFERRMTSLNRKQQLEFLARCTAIFADITRPSETVLRILDETREEVRFLPPGFVGLAQVHVTMSEHHRLDRGQKPVEGLLGELHGAAGARLMGHFGESGYPVPGSSGHVTFEESHRVLGIQGADLLAAEASRLHETGGPHVVAGAFERVLLNGREVRT